jgi:hypothetical protein
VHPSHLFIVTGNSTQRTLDIFFLFASSSINQPDFLGGESKKFSLRILVTLSIVGNNFGLPIRQQLGLLVESIQGEQGRFEDTL